ncbi:MAG: hypothetical protein ABSH56_25255 [Bryobacteraceae bacterium]|jgi:hypothetical protein
MRPQSELIEGPEAAARLDLPPRKALSVPDEEITRREAQQVRRSLANPNRQGPRRKGK